MITSRRFTLPAALLLLGVLAVCGTSCRQETEQSSGLPDWSGIFGNGYADHSPVICRVGDLEITQNDMDRRYEELPPALMSRFSGQGWEMRFLRYMVEEALLTQEAVNRKLFLEPGVSQRLISQYRTALKAALRDHYLMEGFEPTEEQIVTYYEQNQADYRREGKIHARHIPCQSREAAQDAYNQIMELEAEEPNVFIRLVASFSTNQKSAVQAGDLGWFTVQGFIPALTYGEAFATTIWDWPIDVHPPVEIGGEWHVIEILDKDFDRPMALEEARDRVLSDLVPVLQEELVEEWLRATKLATDIEYFGDFRPGGGLTDRELFERAWYANTPEQKIDIYKLLIEDYPDSEWTDDALFMIANVYMDTWSDVRLTSRYLNRLVKDYPESELYDDAVYIRDNLNSPSFRKPVDIDDLRPGGRTSETRVADDAGPFPG
ncbi:MAG: peptidyl-prolyl cis-trans isomerase [bacterium]